MTDEAQDSGIGGLLAKAKAAVAKATEAVSGLVKKDDADPDRFASAADDIEPTENASKMKEAVEAARKNKEDD